MEDITEGVFGIIVSGASGSGKTTVVKHLLDTFPQLSFSVSMTTREPRPGEIHGRDYYFVSREIFEEYVKKGMMLEYEEVYSGYFYGTPLMELERIKREGKVALFDVDVFGAINIKKKLGERSCSIFIAVSSIEKLSERLIFRNTEGDDAVKKRLERAKKEMEFYNKFDFMVVNERLVDTFAEVDAIVSQFLKKHGLINEY